MSHFTKAFWITFYLASGLIRRLAVAALVAGLLLGYGTLIVAFLAIVLEKLAPAY